MSPGRKPKHAMQTWELVGNKILWRFVFWEGLGKYKITVVASPFTRGNALLAVKFSQLGWFEVGCQTITVLPADNPISDHPSSPPPSLWPQLGNPRYSHMRLSLEVEQQILYVYFWLSCPACQSLQSWRSNGLTNHTAGANWKTEKGKTKGCSDCTVCCSAGPYDIWQEDKEKNCEE